MEKIMIYDYNITEQIEGDNIIIVPMDKEAYYNASTATRSDMYSQLKTISRLFFRDRRNNLVYIEPPLDIDYLHGDLEILGDAFKTIKDYYVSQNNALIVLNTINFQHYPQTLIKILEYYHFTSIEVLLGETTDLTNLDGLMVYMNDLIGNKIIEKRKAIWER